MGIPKLYYGFTDVHLPAQAERIAYLQLVSRLEELLTKEFVYYAYIEHGVVAETNVKGGKRRYDIAFLGGTAENPVVSGLVEVKYLRNCHRTSVRNRAHDETKTALKSLRSQLRKPLPRVIGGYERRLSNPSGDAYGLVFASYASDELKCEGKSEFRRGIDGIELTAGKDFRFLDQMHLKKAYLRPAYEDVAVEWKGKNFYCTLWVGLWRRA